MVFNCQRNQHVCVLASWKIRKRMFCTDEKTQWVPTSMNVEFKQHKKKIKKNKKKERKSRKNQPQSKIH